MQSFAFRKNRNIKFIVVHRLYDAKNFSYAKRILF